MYNGRFTQQLLSKIAAGIRCCCWHCSNAAAGVGVVAANVAVAAVCIAVVAAAVCTAIIAVV